LDELAQLGAARETLLAQRPQVHGGHLAAIAHDETPLRGGLQNECLGDDAASIISRDL
jgi:hypothetical protein